MLRVNKFGDVTRFDLARSFLGRGHDASAAIRSKIEHLETLGERVLSLDAEGRTVREIARELCGGPMPMELFTLWHFSRQRLVLSYLRRNPDPR